MRTGLPEWATEVNRIGGARADRFARDGKAANYDDLIRDVESGLVQYKPGTLAHQYFLVILSDILEMPHRVECERCHKPKALPNYNPCVDCRLRAAVEKLGRS